MRVILELVRIIFIFLFLGLIFSTLLRYLYQAMDVNIDRFGWVGSFPILVLLFVLYRNKLQFSGWYIGKERVKLSTQITKILVSGSIFVLITIPILSYIVK